MEKYTGSKRGQAAATECSGSKTKSKSKVDQAAGSQKSRNSNDTDVGTGSISLRVLECVVCFGPLSPPIYRVLISLLPLPSVVVLVCSNPVVYR
ncbi:hypothetical protein BHE74_00025499 [Ensete ventricosum]|nr:hypothetical protein GW17_00025476 [Ensete ventricosum]RWW67073.1 hypothetical protein BHE74_00025499 [Ensete ventricosum]